MVGCAHGELETIYASLDYLQRKENINIELILCCGDFQAVRNSNDLESLACPPKYRRLNSFHKFYSGELKAPALTIFIGGNHEASNHLHELEYGGWVAPNMYYLGNAGVVNFAGLRIGGLSGIFKKYDYPYGHYEIPPYNSQSIRSVFHIRSFEVFQLKQIRQPLDIFLSHDWPAGVAKFGNLQELYRAKPFLRPEIESNTFGSPPAAELLRTLRPAYWFCAHIHVKYAAIVPHTNNPGDRTPDGAEKSSSSHSCTKFLALDKAEQNKDFLQV